MMRISQIIIENFKAFRGKHVFDIKNNLIFLVGENNTGKTTLFEAVNFVKSGLPDKKKVSDLKNKFATDDEHIVCTIKFIGNIKEVITNFSEPKYEPYVFEEERNEVILVQRSSEDKTIIQNGKTKQLSVKTVTIWNPATSQFENPSGVDTVIGSLFEAQFIWADTDPADVSDFGSTKICGRLLNGAIGNFFEGDQWQKFSKVHHETFHGDGTGDSLSKRTEAVEGRIKTILLEQYGDVGIKFNFSLPEPSAFYKAGDIQVNDGVETKLEEKGTGLQRAIAIAMIQVYAQNLTIHPTDVDKTKPLFFFIDEPEICLHPRAQKQLIDAMVLVSKTQQIFISTHSPYLLKTFDSTSHDLFSFERGADSVKATPSCQMKLFGWSPSWGEINYIAYGLATVEFHDELYGALHERFISSAPDVTEADRRSRIDNFDLEILAGGNTAKQTIPWSRLRGGVQQIPFNVTLTTFIRNEMHHPESSQTYASTESDLKKSIECMINILKNP
ncbi:MAG: AAA family ATPase [Lutibacter sp.]|jgi:AAA15 family ATPase/GTPase